MIYVIDNCYALNHKKECIILRNKNLSIEEMTDVVGALANLYYRNTDGRQCPPEKLMEPLCEKFECKDRKHKYSGEMEFIERRIQSPMLHATFVLHGEIVVWIDISEAMDYVFSRMYSVLNEYLEEDEIKKIETEWRK